MGPRLSRWLFRILLLVLVIGFAQQCSPSDQGDGPAASRLTRLLGGSSAFEMAVLTGDLASADRMLAEDPSRLDARGPDGETLLTKAALSLSNEAERRRIVAWLVAKGADVNAASSSGTTALYSAVHHGDREVAELLLEHGAEANSRHTQGRTPLHLAATDGSAELVGLLLGHGADVNATDDAGETPLFLAAKGGFTEVVKLLADGGADVNLRSKDGVTPLHLAARDGRKDMVELLLAHGADATAEDGTGSLPVTWAASARHADIVAILMSRAPDMLDPARPRWTKLHAAAQAGSSDEVRRLLRAGARVDPADGNGQTPLHFACDGGHLEVARLLLTAGADPNRADEANGATPLHLAAARGDTKMIALLAENRASGNATDRYGRTPLFEVACAGNEPAARILLDHGADPEANDRKGVSLLHQAVRCNRPELASVLASHGAKVDLYSAACMNRLELAKTLISQDPKAVSRKFVDGETPLHAAARCGGKEAVDLLVSRGAKADAISSDGLTPLAAAAMSGRVEAAAALLDAGASVNPTKVAAPLQLATAYGHPDVMRLLLDHGADLGVSVPSAKVPTVFGSVTVGGQTLLELAVMSPSPETVKVLLARGVKATDPKSGGSSALLAAARWGRTEAAGMLLDAGVPAGGAKGGYPPLNLAAHYGHADIVSALLKHGADANVRDRNGWAPLHMALLLEVQEQQRRPMKPSCPVVVRLLVQHGANVRAPGSSFKTTPLHLAAQLGAVDVMQFLIERGAEVNARDSKGYTPLHEAVSNGHLQAAEMLLERGADANAHSEFGCPLHLAAGHNHPEIVELLLARRADINARDARGLSPLDVAIQGCGGLEPNAARTAMVATLLRAGAGVRGTPGKTPPLHRAVGGGDVEVAELLIAHGADTRQFDENGLTPLHLAVSRQDPYMVEWLLAKGADVNARDRGGETPLQYALRGDGPAVRIRELLRAHGGVE